MVAFLARYTFLPFLCRADSANNFNNDSNNTPELPELEDCVSDVHGKNTDELWAVGSKDLTPRYRDVVPYLVKAVILNEHHYGKIFTFGGFPRCVLPKKLLADRAFLQKYMGEYRDLSTDCSIKQDGAGHGIAQVEGGRARFNWQERKRRDLKDQPEACHRCVAADMCEGVWKGYLDIYGDEDFVPFE